MGECSNENLEVGGDTELIQERAENNSAFVLLNEVNVPEEMVPNMGVDIRNSVEELQNDENPLVCAQLNESPVEQERGVPREVAETPLVTPA
ncbi:unnamed protein product, partial [Ilex paraguariensis]